MLLGTGAANASEAFSAARRRANPFTLGVASGDPRADGVVLWTRLAPEPFALDGSGGMSAKPVTVGYEVATSRTFADVVRRGTTLATEELGHSVHPELSGLEPDRPYWYRFRVGAHHSPIGRTRTTPDLTTAPRELNFAFASCQKWHDGFFTAYDHMADEDLDLVVHLGDYIYESGTKRNVRGVDLPSVFGREAYNLRRYRLRYTLYKSDRSLQRAHARFPWIHTMDDHEVENNWARDWSQPDHGKDQVRAVFRRRRAAAFQAMYENLPLRIAQLPKRSHIRLHRRLPYGNLADFTMLDTRQYRSNQPCEVHSSSTCKKRFDPDQTMLGGKQKRWLLNGFSASTARWQLLGNQAPMAQWDDDPDPDRTEVYLDPWDGYVAERNQVLGASQDRQVRNLVVITGDRHTHQALDLKRDHADPESATVGTELIGTSISTDGDGAGLTREGRNGLATNPHLKFFNARRGYVRVNVTAAVLRADFRVLPYVERRGAPIRTAASFVVEDGRPGTTLD